MDWEEGHWVVIISADGNTVRVTLDEFAESGPCKVVVEKAFEERNRKRKQAIKRPRH
jgi:hypothetical protein